MGRGKLHFMAAIVPKFEDCLADFEAFDPLDETAPIGAAPEFTVIDDLQTHIFLHANDRPDAFVLNAGKVGVGKMPVYMLLESLAQRGRAKEASDMIGTERRTAFGKGFHYLSSTIRAC
jgi:hypothetical protein